MMKFIVILSIAVMGAIGEEKEGVVKTAIPNPKNSIQLSCIGKCPKINTVPWEPFYTPHISCDKFCLCLGSVMAIGTCPEGMGFANSTTKCVARPDDECSKKSTEPRDDTEGCLEKCPETNSGDSAKFSPHEADNKFCLCNWGKPVVLECPSPLHFNKKTQSCDFASNAN